MRKIYLIIVGHIQHFTKHFMKLNFSLFFLIICSLSLSAQPPSSDYELVFSDEFLGSSISGSENMKEIEVRHFKNGIYHVVFQNDALNLNTTFLKNGGN